MNKFTHAATPAATLPGVTPPSPASGGTYSEQDAFDQTVFKIRCAAADLDGKPFRAEIGMVELTELSIAAARINAFVLRNRRRAA